MKARKVLLPHPAMLAAVAVHPLNIEALLDSPSFCHFPWKHSPLVLIPAIIQIPTIHYHLLFIISQQFQFARKARIKQYAQVT